MLLNELLKLAVHRHRPFLDGWFVDWSGYSFASGHTIGAAAMLVMLVGFSRIALGAHYLSDVIAAIFLGSVWLMICALLLRSMQRTIVVPVAIPVEEPRPASVATADIVRELSR
ncbi:MAG: hypothetical protein DME32_05230 [Verrucomicrobia bacterium]|nr:MAG: hypothetical protein DME32_05230 [Verrucomicrobiota bacterium]